MIRDFLHLTILLLKRHKQGNLLYIVRGRNSCEKGELRDPTSLFMVKEYIFNRNIYLHRMRHPLKPVTILLLILNFFVGKLCFYITSLSPFNV